MTHPLIDVGAGMLSEAIDELIVAEGEADRAFIKRLLLALLRHPAMREPSVSMLRASTFPSRSSDRVLAAWEGMVDALRREVEEG